MSLMRVSISWNQARALSQRLPRFSKTEGSPVQPQSRKAPRGYGYLIGPGHTPRQPVHSRPQSISYRLPKLADNSRRGIRHGYVFKEPHNEAQFLLRKDSRTPLPATASAPSAIPAKTRSLNRQTDLAQGSRNLLSRSGLRARGVPPPWNLTTKRDISLPVIEADQHRTKEPRTPPQSEIDSNLMPAVHLRTKTSSHPSYAVRETKQSFPAVLMHKDYDDRKLTWQLSPFDNKNFDRQGLGPNQGPFSRELPKKCMPPANWLRMKLRQRIQIRKADRRQPLAVI